MPTKLNNRSTRIRGCKTPSNKSRTIRGGGDRNDHVFESDKISTQPNTDPSYKEMGIVHVSESRGINLVRGAITDIVNVFGKKGVDNVIYDKLRNETLEKMINTLHADEKICNLRMDFENPTPSLLFSHACGTLMKKMKAAENKAANQKESVHFVPIEQKQA